MQGSPVERTVVLGLGNVLRSDDGLGVMAVRELTDRHHVPPEVDVLDGGTLGLALLGVLKTVRRTILVDAVHARAPAGTLIRLVGEDVAGAARERLSVHQPAVADLLDGACWFEGLPEELVLLGLVPQEIRLGLARSAAVEHAIPALVAAIVSELVRLGHRVSERTARPVASGSLARRLGGAAR